jgi:cell wall-associated NlpC family hydrolase
MIPAYAFEETMGVVNASALNFRAAPSREAEVLTVLRRGAALTLHGQDGEWYKASLDGFEGYVNSAFVTRTDPAEGPLVITEYMLLTSYAEPSYIEDDSPVSEDTPFPMSGLITGSVVNLRSGPSTATAALTQLRRGAAVEVLAAEGVWVQVSSGHLTGWMHGNYVHYSPDLAAAGDTSAQRADLVARSLSYLGVRYILGGASPSGFDCSGFTQYIFRQFGHTIHRTASTQLNNGTAIRRSELLPGDLVFFRDPSRGNFAATHVGIYVGNNQFIHATRPGDVVSVTTMATGYYNRYFSAARRILP